MTIWFLHTTLALACLIYLAAKRELASIGRDLRKYPGTILGLSIGDNLAWISYAFAVNYIPISIATTISEAYVALTVLLGIFVNREKIKKHQLIGVALAVIGVIALSAITGD